MSLVHTSMPRLRGQSQRVYRLVTNDAGNIGLLKKSVYGTREHPIEHRYRRLKTRPLC